MAEENHTGAMIALVPADADMLALDGYEPVEELHCTMFFLGENGDIPDEVRAELISGVEAIAREVEAPEGNVFGVNVWNPDGDSPSWNLAVGDVSGLVDVRGRVNALVRGAERHGWEPPENHSPWVPHICVAYAPADELAVPDVAKLVGPVTFDRLWLALGEERILVPFSGEPVTAAAGEPVPEGPQARKRKPRPVLAAAIPETAVWVDPLAPWEIVTDETAAWAVPLDAANPYHDELGRFTHGPGGPDAPTVTTAPPLTRADLSNPDTPRSREVSPEEFQELVDRGRSRLAELRANPKAPTDGVRNPEKWESIKASSYDAVQEEWGGATIDAHTGEPVEGDADVYAMSVRPPGVSSVSVPIGADRATFDTAMEEARSTFATELTYDQFHLGVFRDEDVGRIDIDPVLIVDNIGDVESIGAYTRAVGGAYHFASGDGFWPPHVAERVPVGARG